MRIAFAGGVPPALGGGGLEAQMDRTAAALRRRGHEVVHVEREPDATPWDLLHAFGAEGNVQFMLEHWTRHRGPLVISPVLVVSPGPAERALRVSSRIPLVATHAALRRRALLRADRLVAITGYERDLLRDLTGGRVPVDVVPNGVDPVEPAHGSEHEGHVLLLGSVSERKRQREAIEAIDGAAPIVIAGAWADGDRPAFEAAVRRSGATWLGEVRDAARVAALQRDAAALVHFSTSEVQSLAVLETLRLGTPVVLSDIPSHRELAGAHPDFVRIARSAGDLAPLVRELAATRPSGPAPRIPDWDAVAEQLERIYAQLA